MSKSKVWGLPIRIFHIFLILLVSISYYTSENMHVFTFSLEARPSQFDLHRWSGYSVMILVLTRIIWGLVGSTTARFGHFLKGPKGIAAYTSKLLGDNYSPSVGHNPIGGWSVVLMLGLLLVQTITGLLSSEDTFGLEGPLDHLVSTRTSYWLAGIHELTFNTLLVVIGLHICAAFFYLLAKKDNLIVPMITGCKETNETEDIVFRPAWIALLIVAAASVLLWAVLSTL